MGEEEEGKVKKTCAGIGHGRATFGTGRASTLSFCSFFLAAMWHGRATFSTGRVVSLDFRGSKFCVFLEF